MKRLAKTYKRGIIIGAVVGVVIFLCIGIVPGSFVGGTIGLNMASILFDAPFNPELTPRLIVATSMVIGVLLSALMIVTISALVGMAGTSLIAHLRAERKLSSKVALKG